MADDAEIILLRLSKAGYGGGNPEVINEMELSWIIKMIDYESFCSEYEDEHYNLNKNG